MMESIRIKNLRCLRDTGEIPLKPLTILVGANSTGKSSFLRLFPLLKQSVETFTNNPILWYKQDHIDLGSINEAIYSKAQSIAFEFGFKLPADTLLNINQESQLIKVELELTPRQDENKSQVSKLSIHLGIDKAVLLFDEIGKVTDFYVNERDFIEKFENLQIVNTINIVPFIIPSVFELSQSIKSTIVYKPEKFYSLLNDDTLFGYIKKISINLNKFYKNDDNQTHKKVFKLALDVGLGYDKDIFLNRFDKHKNGRGIWKPNISKIKDSDLQLIRDTFFAVQVPIILTYADEIIAQFASGVHYIGPLRANAQRYYRLQNLAVQALDSRGENVPMYLNSLSEKDRKEFAQWSKENFGIEIDIKKQIDQLTIMVKEHNTPEPKNLIDVGFGYSQILPVIIQLWLLRAKKIKTLISLTAIEQPELHLHPQLQAQLADVFAFLSQQKSSPRLLIETHSETIINRLGQLIELKKLSPDEVQVVLFEADDKEPGCNKVRLAHYHQDGYLVDWPYGFFLPEML